jgi:transposase
MGDHPRKADGRRVFSTEFKRTTVQRILSGEKTLAELSRELDISPSVIRTWKRFAESGATTAVQASEDVVPASQLREAYAKIRELERALGRKTMENEILRAAQEVVKKNAVLAQSVRTVTGHTMTAICGVLGIARRTAYYLGRARPSGRQHRATDDTVLQQIRAVTNRRATYGYRRVWAMINRTFRTRYNRKRIRRVMQRHGLMLTPRVHRRHGRPHLGQIQQPASNQRWCSDVCLIPCWSGEVVSVAFAIDCHDREVPAFVASPRSLTGADIRTLMDRTLWARFGEATLKAPHAIQWLSDNCPQYTATASVLYAHELGLVPITTPAYSPESNGLPKPSSARSSAIMSAPPTCATPRACSPSSRDGLTTTTARPRTRPSGCVARASTAR